MDLQYYHKRKSGDEWDCYEDEYTAVVDVPNKELFLDCVNQALGGHRTTLTFNVGFTKVIKGDQYCKAIGREKALQYIGRVEYDSISIYLNRFGKVEYTLHPNNKIGPSLVFELKESRKRVYLTKVII